MFLACPVPEEVARALHRWAGVDLVCMRGLRVVPAEQMHVTLMFFGNVSTEARAMLAELCEKVVWHPFPVFVGGIEVFGRKALGAWLDADPEEFERLDELVGRGYMLSAKDPRAVALLEAALRIDDPMVLLSRNIGKDDFNEKWLRKKRGEPLNLHITIARLGKEFKLDPSWLNPPPIEFELGPPALYESHLRSEGARYEKVAVSCREVSLNIDSPLSSWYLTKTEGPQ